MGFSANLPVFKAYQFRTTFGKSFYRKNLKRVAKNAKSCSEFATRVEFAHFGHCFIKFSQKNMLCVENQSLSQEIYQPTLFVPNSNGHPAKNSDFPKYLENIN